MVGFRFPFDIDLTPEIMPPLSMAIGGIVLAWGSAEASLNINIVMIFQLAGGRHHAEEGQIPVAMGRKLKFIRLCLKNIAALEPFREEGLALFQKMGAMAKTRNNIVHGFLSAVDREKMVFTFTGLGSIKDKPLITGQPQYSMQDLIKLVTDSMKLAAEVVCFMKRLSETFIPQQPQNDAFRPL